MTIDIGLREQLVFDIDNIIEDLDTAEYFRQNENRQQYRTRVRKELSTEEGIDQWIQTLEHYRKDNPEVVHKGTIRDLEYLKRTIGGKKNGYKRPRI